MVLDPKPVIKINTACKDIALEIIIWIFCMDSLRFRSWEDFSLGWWNALTSAWLPDVCHFENFTMWIQLRLGLHERAWKVTKGNSWKLSRLSMTIFFKFWSRDCCRICINSSWTCCCTCIVEQVTSEVVDKMLSWVTLGLSYSEHKLVWKWTNLSVQLWRQCLVNPWILTVLFLIITIAAMSAAVSLQFARGDFADSISTGHFHFNRLYSTLLTKYGVYNAVKYFSRNK